MGRNRKRLRARRITAYMILLFVLLAALNGKAQNATPGEDENGILRGTQSEDTSAVQQFMAGPSVFIQNVGQWADASVQFALDASGANVGMTDQGPRFQLFRQTSDGSDLSAPVPSEMIEFGMAFDGAARIAPTGRGQSDRTFNYLLGNATDHRKAVPSFNSVWYDDLYPGIALELTGKRTGIKYNFHVAPGADWRAIRVRYDGVEGLSLRPDGTLEIRVAEDWNTLTDSTPYIYQEVNGEKLTVAGRFSVLDGHTYGFEITGAYDPTLPIVIDPDIAWGAYLGGGSADIGHGVAVDSSGNVYATGETASSGWISGSGWDTTYNGGVVWGDGYIVKLSSAGAHLWSTYLGGASEEIGYGIAIDSNGNVYATGETYSDGWVSGGEDTMFGENHDGIIDGYVVKLDTNGGHLWSTYLGGTLLDVGGGIALDPSANVYATGTTGSTDWVNGGWDTILNADDSVGCYDGFVVKLDTDGAFVWSTYMGEASNDYAWGIAVDSGGNAYATGDTSSSGWVSGGEDNTLGGSVDGYVVKLDTNGGHVWSTYLGGDASEYGYGIAVDSSGNAYATGVTGSSDWVGNGWDTELGGATDGYVVKLDTTGTELWSTYLGGDDSEYGQGIAVDSNGSAYATGNTGGTPPGWVSDGWDTTHNGGANDAYVVKLNTDGTHLWSSYLGSTADDQGYGIAVDSNGGLCVTGSTTSSGWISDGWDVSYGGAKDGYVVKIDLFYISQHPLGAQLYIDSPYTATVAAANGQAPLSYQWTHNGTDIPGATDTVFSLPSVILSNAGTYACRVMDSINDTVTSMDAVLQVAEHIAIVTQPDSLTVPEGQPATFSVEISGGLGPISYQWKKDGGDITGADQSAYTIGSTRMGNEGDYTCVVTDEFVPENVVSDIATLTVIPGLPAAGGLALATAVLAMGLAGALRLRRRTK